MTDPIQRQTRRNEKLIERWLAEISDHNRPDVRRLLKWKADKASSTRQGYVNTLRKLDASTNHKPWREIDADDLMNFTSGLVLRRHSVDTIDHHRALAKLFLKFVHNERHLPLDFDRALEIHGNRKLPDRPVVSQETIDAMLASAPDLRDQTVLALLYECGYRVTELISHNVGGVRFDGQDGAWLAMPDLPEGLKTGPREVYVARYAGLLRAYLTTHPTRSEPDSPLFYHVTPKNRTPKPGTQLTKQSVQRIVAKACTATGTPRLRNHDFRHTSATRASEAGLNAFDLSERYGWVPHGRHIRRYLHHSRTHKERMARKAAGITDEGQPVAKTGAEMKACRACAEPIRVAAIKCRYCYERLADAPRPYDKGHRSGPPKQP